MNSNNKYTLSREELKNKLNEFFYNEQYKVKNHKHKFILYCGGYIDDEGNLHSRFLEDFDKAMKEELKKYLKEDQDKEIK